MLEFDIAVIGGGINGCLAARRLARGGAAVALLEAGPDPADPSFAERAGKSREQQPVQSQLYVYSDQTAPFLVNDLDHPYATPEDAPYLWFRGRQLGGLMHLWDGCSPRLTEAQLGDGAGWPIGYSELVPYYLEAERELRVRALPLAALERRMAGLIEREFPDAKVIPRPISELVFSELRQDFAKLKTLTVITDAIVYELHWSPARHRLEAIRYIDGRSGEPKEVRARTVVLCASTLETTRILLHSRSSDYPTGLGNSSGVLGKFLMDHATGIVYAGKAIPTPSPSNGIYIYRQVNGGQRRYGCEAQFASEADGGSFWIAAFGEVDPSPSNQVTLDPDRRDCWGIPIIRVNLRYSDADRSRMADANAFCEAVLERARLSAEPDRCSRSLAIPGASIHETGTARMGSNRTNSFLNKFNQSWDVPGLFVTDGAAFPRSPHPNPTLTTVALTLRACDIALSQLRRAGASVT